MINENSNGGIFALLDSPIGSNISIDGKSIVLKRDDFVGFAALKSFAFHLIAFQAFPTSSHKGGCGSSRHGIVLLTQNDKNNDNWMVAHRYNPKTEEIDPSPIDRLTIMNLESSIRSNHLGPPRVICSNDLLSETEMNDWQRSTTFISVSLLQKRQMFHGCKIVPGAFREDEDSKITTNSESLSRDHHVDGRELHYPPIPIVGGNSNKWCKHNGTKKYLASLNPSQRTDFLVSMQDNSSPTTLVDHILDEYYDQRWEELLGDVQLSYIMFMHLQCLSSLEHWRDLIAMLSFVQLDRLESNAELYGNLMDIMTLQMKYIDHNFFAELEFSEGNFFVPAVQRLIATIKDCTSDQLKEKSKQVECSIRSLLSTNLSMNSSEFEDHNSFIQRNDDRMNDDYDDDDGPAIVSAEEYGSSMERFAKDHKKKFTTSPTYPVEHQQKYAILFASMQPHEDILMTCARALDSQVDVSLVREAAKYLEEVESKKPNSNVMLLNYSN